jgi:GNAT superfamily N-acetyltransferase
MDINIRIADTKDLTQLTLLLDAYRVFYKQESNPKAAYLFLEERLLLKESIIIVAEHNGQLLGFTQLYPNFSSVSLERDYILNDLYVNQEHRGNKIGKQLLNYAQEIVANKGYKGLMLETDMMNPAQHLYEREGWIKDQGHFFYYWENENRKKQ